MPQDEEIELASLQFEKLLNEEQKEAFTYLLKHAVFCPSCSNICPQGVVNHITVLTDADELLMKGKCAKCGSGVTRLMLIEEDAGFADRVKAIRNN
jgi:formate hydrogenlyase subunit 6/NADH:ubiquinone oxidoreductase subunit I